MRTPRQLVLTRSETAQVERVAGNIRIIPGSIPLRSNKFSIYIAVFLRVLEDNQFIYTSVLNTESGSRVWKGIDADIPVISRLMVFRSAVDYWEPELRSLRLI